VDYSEENILLFNEVELIAVRLFPTGYRRMDSL
jgi:hypothetical protein